MRHNVPSRLSGVFWNDNIEPNKIGKDKTNRHECAGDLERSGSIFSGRGARSIDGVDLDQYRVLTMTNLVRGCGSEMMPTRQKKNLRSSTRPIN
jgi:hypothetical protein